MALRWIPLGSFAGRRGEGGRRATLQRLRRVAGEQGRACVGGAHAHPLRMDYEFADARSGQPGCIFGCASGGAEDSLSARRCSTWSWHAFPFGGGGVNKKGVGQVSVHH